MPDLNTARVLASLLVIVLFLVGFAGIPEDTRTWGGWVKRIGDALSTQRARGICVLGACLLALLTWAVPGSWWSEALGVERPFVVVDIIPTSDSGDYVVIQREGDIVWTAFAVRATNTSEIIAKDVRVQMDSLATVQGDRSVPASSPPSEPRTFDLGPSESHLVRFVWPGGFVSEGAVRRYVAGVGTGAVWIEGNLLVTYGDEGSFSTSRSFRVSRKMGEYTERRME